MIFDGEILVAQLLCGVALRQARQQPPGAGDRLADAHLFLHVPDAGGDGMDHGNFEVFLHRHDVDNAPGAGAEQIDSLGRRKRKRRQAGF